MPDKEQKYLDLLAEGNIQAFDYIYITYAPRTEELLCRMLKSSTEAEDITHDIFLKIWNKREELSKISSLRDYIFRMAKNAAYDRFDHDIVKEKYHLRQMRIPQAEELTDKDIDADELAVILAMAIEKMPPQRRKIFNMSRYDEKSNKQIAEELGLSVRTVESHIANAMRELKKLLAVVAFFL